MPKSFSEGNTVTPKPKGSVTKANINGKYIRKQPEEKETINKHIDYIRRKDGVRISYHRDYYIYKKVLSHKFRIGLNFTTNPHGQKLIVSNELTFSTDDSQLLLNKHTINMFCEIFNDFEVFDKDLNPAIHFNTKFDKVILPPGYLNDADSFEQLIKISNRFINNDEDKSKYYRRLKVLQEFNPDISGKGANGFSGYFAFGFKDLGIVITESIVPGNATYIFPIDNYEINILKDKQTVLKDNLHIVRFEHNDNWETNLRRFIDNIINSQ